MRATTDPDRATFEPQMSADVHLEMVVALNQAAPLRLDESPQLRESHPLLAASEKRRAELGLQQLDAPRKRGLRQPQGSRGVGDGAAPGYLH